MSDTEPPAEIEDPIGHFIDDLEYHGKTARTRSAYERVLRRFEAFLTGEGSDLRDAGRRECMAWVHRLRTDVAPSTVATYAAYVHRFYAYMTEVGVFESNPMTLVMGEMDESIDTDPTRRDVSIAEMRRFVADITHPLERALVLTLLKTGMRVGELCNLDRRDVHLSGLTGSASVPVEPRGVLDSHPNALFVDSEISRSEFVNDEKRKASNKRKRSTIIPIDTELRSVLVTWMAVRPDARSAAEPLFMSTNQWGRRVTPAMVRAIVTDHAKDSGWYREGANRAENVTPHYFRHFFTTHLRDRTGDRGVVKYLRGDVASDIIDTYTHDWGDRVREVYEANIYRIVDVEDRRETDT